MRKREVIKRHVINPDPKFDSVIVSRLINKVMKNGEKRKARNIVYEAAQIIEKKSSLPFLTVFEGARTNAKPGLELKSWKIGGTKRQIPIEVKSEWRAEHLALMFIVQSAREAKRKSRLPFFQILGEIIFDACHNKGGAIQKKEAIQKKGEENKAFAVFLNRSAK